MPAYSLWSRYYLGNTSSDTLYASSGLKTTRRGGSSPLVGIPAMLRLNLINLVAPRHKTQADVGRCGELAERPRTSDRAERRSCMFPGCCGSHSQHAVSRFPALHWPLTAPNSVILVQNLRVN